MAYAPLIPGTTISGDSNYTVHDSYSSGLPSGNKTKSPVILDSSNTWSGTSNISAQSTYKFLQSMNVSALEGIDLGYAIGLDDYDFEIKFKWAELPDLNKSKTALGIYNVNYTTAGELLFQVIQSSTTTANGVRISATSRDGWVNSFYFTTTPTEALNPHTYAIKYKKCYLDGNYVNELPSDKSYPTPNNFGNLTLFSSTNTRVGSSGTFYSLKIWYRGELIHDYIPCIKYTSSGTEESIGVYDLITYTYLTRNNSTELSNNLESGSTDWAYRQGISEEGFLYDSFAVQVTNSNTETLAGVGISGDAVIDTAYNAVWNDMTDLIEVPEDTDLKFGKCYCFDGETYKESSKYLDDGFLGIHSDTSGMVLGYKGEGKKHLQAAIAGFALAYVDKEYPSGTPLTCGENGFLTELKKEDLPKNSHKLVGTFWKREWSDWWGFNRAQTDNLVKFVDGRMWIKVR